MADEFKHTTVSEMDTFMAKSQASQLLEIWLNGRETNGEVAAQRARIEELGLELQKARHDLSEHLEHTPHPDRRDTDEFNEIVEQHRDLWSVWRFSRWFIPLSIPLSIGLVTAGIEVLRLIGVGT